MAQSDGFAKLWKNNQFRGRLQALAVDEAHCIEEWGTDEFRPHYRSLSVLRHFTGQEIPFVSFTATCTTATFDRLWESLAYGFRPFWGLDVGSDRPNLFYEVRAMVNRKYPVLDVLGLLPSSLDDNTPRTALPKTIMYFDSEDACRLSTDILRKCLPPHLRSAVYAFSSVLSEKAKEQCWQRFSGKGCRFLCATDAAGMGCNVADIKNIVIFNCPRSLSVVSQRWGRAGRDRTTPAMCLLLVPGWAFRPSFPSEPSATLSVRHLKGKSKQLLEPKSHTLQREKLPVAVERFINTAVDVEQDANKRNCSQSFMIFACADTSHLPGCLHHVLRQSFEPVTELTTYSDLANEVCQGTGRRSRTSPFFLAWTVLDLARHPPRTRCCYLCNPDHPDRIPLPVVNDPRLMRYAQDFLIPLVQPPTRPSSVLTEASQSRMSDSSTQNSGTTFEPLVGEHSVAKEMRELLRQQLLEWREKGRLGENRDLLFLSPAVDFPDKAIDKLVENCARFLTVAEVSTHDVVKVVQWDSSTSEDHQEIARLISFWRVDAALTATPKSQRHKRKKARTEDIVDKDSLDAEIDVSPTPSPRPQHALRTLGHDTTPRPHPVPFSMAQPPGVLTFPAVLPTPAVSPRTPWAPFHAFPQHPHPPNSSRMTPAHASVPIPPMTPPLSQPQLVLPIPFRPYPPPVTESLFT